MIQSLTEQLERDEGTILHAYQDSKGYWTIGTGICIDNRVGCGITAEENIFLLKNRTARSYSLLSETYPWTDALDGIRRAVLVNMIFNMGLAGLSEFRQFLGALQSGNFQEAADRMLDSEWEKQVGSRAHRLAQQIITGEWQ